MKSNIFAPLFNEPLFNDQEQDVPVSSTSTYPEFHLIWTVDGETVHGYDAISGTRKSGIFSHGPLFPWITTDWKTAFVSSSCAFDRTEFSLTSIKLFLQADPDTLQIFSDLAGNGFGVQVSFNEGWDYICLTGNPKFIAPAAIITSPAAVGVMGPYDTLRFQFRISLPEDFAPTGKLLYRIGIDFEVE